MVNRVENWNFTEVSVWLRKVGLEKYIDLFYFHEIDGEVLLSMTERDLYASSLKITTFGDIRKFGVAIEKLKTENNANQKQAADSSHLGIPKSVPVSSVKELPTDCTKKTSQPAFVPSSDTEYDNDIEGQFCIKLFFYCI